MPGVLGESQGMAVWPKWNKIMAFTSFFFFLKKQEQHDNPVEVKKG